VATGRCTSASEVIREALRLMDERDQVLALRKGEIVIAGAVRLVGASAAASMSVPNKSMLPTQ
jgi:Arc/MetJ-type ribon-helix-helix transcriptional regulator